MTKRIALMAILFLVPALARADSFVSVTMLPEFFLVAGGETVGATFTWDTTTNIISDITVTATGTYWQGVDHLPAAQLPAGPFRFFNFVNQAGDIFQLNYGIHGSFAPFLPSVPGTYITDLWLSCPQCAVHGNGEFNGFGPGKAVVTSLGDGDHDGDDPVSTPEPSGLVSLLAGLSALALLLYIRAH